MKVQIALSELTSLVRQIDLEVACLIQSRQRQSLDFASSRSECLVIASRTKKIEVHSVVIPFDLQAKDTFGFVSLGGARLEVTGAWRVDETTPWIRNTSFGEHGSLIVSLPSLDIEHIEAAAAIVSEYIGKYLDVQLECC